MTLQSHRAGKMWRQFKVFRIFWLLLLVAIAAFDIYDRRQHGQVFDWMLIWGLLGMSAGMCVLSVFFYCILKLLDDFLAEKEKRHP